MKYYEDIRQIKENMITTIVDQSGPAIKNIIAKVSHNKYFNKFGESALLATGVEINLELHSGETRRYYYDC